MKKITFCLLIFSFVFIGGCASKTSMTDQSVAPAIPVSPSNDQTALRKIRQIDWTLFYEGTVTVSGKYVLNPQYHDSLPGLFCFYVDETTAHLIPRGLQALGDTNYNDTRPPWFCFSNKEDAVKKFFSPQSLPNPKCNYGTATVEISHYIANLKGADAYDTAILEKASLRRLGAGC